MKTLKENTYAVAAAWLAFGMDKSVLFRQSDIAEVSELMWFLNCVTPYPMLANAHSFKEKSEYFLSDVSAGLFTYPVLMAADILLYGANYVPVGKDQKQHIEMTRDIAKAFNNRYKTNLVIPEAKYNESAMLVPGTDGRKMGKSYNNTINIFLPEKELRKSIMSIVTGSTPMEEPKDPDNCYAFKIFSLIADERQVEEMRSNYLKGGYGYGQAKEALCELVLTRFKKERTLYDAYMSKKFRIDAELCVGALTAKEIATDTLNTIKRKMGLREFAKEM